jgi:hypothetical protein
MSTTQDPLRTLARRAYERGRMKRALMTCAYALPMVAFSVVVRGPTAGILAAGALLVAVIFWMSQRGGALARSIGPGLLAGVPPFAVPLVLHAIGHPCAMGGCMTPACAAICMPACAVGGAVAGIVIGVSTLVESKQPLSTLIGASVIAILAGTLGCWFAGVSGVFGMALATLGASVPLVLVRARRA